MGRLSANGPCPCGSARKYKKCCRRPHIGQPPESAEALMRARYSAYALGLSQFIVDTTHPHSPHAQADRATWLAEVARFCAETEFEGLDVTAHEPGTGAVAWVTFTAHLRRGTQATPMTERSRFVCVGGRWLYVDEEK